MRIGVLDYGAGNIRNVYRAISFLGFEHVAIRSSKDFCSLDKLIIPGVGAFKIAMDQLRTNGLVDPVKDYSLSGMPTLGICLGMQLLFDRSEEFENSEGLGLIKGSILHIRNQYQLASEGIVKVPHIKWTKLDILKSDILLEGLEVDPFHAYFVHSYMACNVDQSKVLASAQYNGLAIPAVVKVNNTYGCQFHPEKSGEQGLRLFRNFLEKGT